MKNRFKGEKIRQSVANEAARILAETGDNDYARARRKAAEHIRCKGRDELPDNAEIALALKDYLQLYAGDQRKGQLADLRRTAINAMETFKEFRPRLTGAVLDGTASNNSPIQLYLHADYPEQLSMVLMDKRIPWEEEDRNLRFSDGSERRYPLFRFYAGDHAVEMICLSNHGLRSPPLNFIDNRPDKGASLEQLRKLLEDTEVNGK